MKNTITHTPRLERGLPASEIGAQAASLRMCKTMKVLACLCLLSNFQFSIFNSPTASAQHFEWAKGYGSAANDGNSIVGTVADSEGNLYILGDFHPDAEWDDEALLPPAMTPYGPYRDTRSVVVAKISPSGEMLWKKVIHGSDDALANDIRMLGDTAIAFMARYTLPSQMQRMYLYYLDTLYTCEDDFVHDLSHMSLRYTTAYIVLDLDGNILEDHALNVTFVDRDGNDVMHEYSSAYGPRVEYRNDVLWYVSFDFDPEGNIYLCRFANDYLNGYGPGYDLENGDLSAVKFWVDDRVAGVMDIPNGTRFWFPQLIKLSPHLDTVLGSRYLVQKGRSGIPYTENLVKCRQNGDVYVIWNIPDTRNFTDTIVCDSLHNIQFKLMKQYRTAGYLCAYNSSLSPKWGITIDRDSTIDSTATTAISWRDICFDEDSNLFFLSSKYYLNTIGGDTSHFSSLFTYNGIPVPVQKTASVVIAFREQEYGDPELVGSGCFPAIYTAGAVGNSIGNMACKNNRIFMQAKVHGGYYLPSDTIVFERGFGDVSLGMAIFDYKMNVIGGYDFDSHSTQTKEGPVIIVDSALYLTNYISSGHAQFGDIAFQGTPTYNYGCIAKYVDNAFMTPYVGEPVVTGILDEQRINMTTPYPNPANDKVQFAFSNEVLLTTNAISILGQRTHLNHNGTSVDVSPLAPGIYIMEIHTSKNDYICKFIKY